MVTPCSRLWTDINLNVNKKEVLNCCKRVQLNTPSVQEISDIKFWSERKEVVDDKKHWMSNASFPKGCQICSLHHPNSAYNSRNRWIEDTPDLSKDHTSYIEIQVGTKCNQTCMYCSYEYSSLWAKKLGVPVKEEDTTWKNAALNSLYKHIEKNLGDKEFITYNFLGGETLIIDDFLDILENLSSLHKNRQQRCAMTIVSNLNVGPSIIQKFINLCKNHPHIEFILNGSIENIGERAEAVREGLDFSRFEHNINWLMSEPSITKVGFLPAMNALSISDHPDFLRWCLSIITKYRKLEDAAKTWQIGYNFVTGPDSMQIGILPDKYTLPVDEAIELVLSVNVNNVSEKQNFLSHLQSLKGQIGTKRDEKFLRHAYRWYRKQEKLHNRDYWKIFPELNDIFLK